MDKIIEFHKRFCNGEQYLVLTPVKGKMGKIRDYTIEDTSKTYYWQEQLVFNKIQPIVEMFITKIHNGEYAKALSDEDLYGENGLVARLVPLQRAYNTIKNKKYEMMNRLTFDNLFVEDGSVDLDSLEEEGLQPGKILVYRQGATQPSLTKFECNFEPFENEEDNILRDICEIVECFKLKWYIKDIKLGFLED